MSKFPKTYNLPKLNQEKTENLNRLITTSEIETVIKKTPSTQKSLTRWLHRWILPNTPILAPILLKLFQKFHEEGRL